MAVVTGRFQEAKLFLSYAFAWARPGARLLTAGPDEPDGPTLPADLDDADLRLVLEQAQRQLDRQNATMESVRARASALLTIAIAEIVLLASSAAKFVRTEPVPTVVAFVCFLLAALAAFGAAGILSGQARRGVLDVRELALEPRPLLKSAAATYVTLIPPGQESLRARVTVLRDAVLLVVLAVLIYAPFYVIFSASDDTEQPSRHGSDRVHSRSCPTSTPFSHGPSHRCAPPRR